jgi:hypothetical protein
MIDGWMDVSYLLKPNPAARPHRFAGRATE